MHALCRRVFHNFGQRRLVMGSLALFRELALLADVVCLSASVTAKWPTRRMDSSADSTQRHGE